MKSSVRISNSQRNAILEKFYSLSSLEELIGFIMSFQFENKNCKDRKIEQRIKNNNGLIYFLVDMHESEKYTTFSIKKRNGNFRKIHAPIDELSCVQKKLCRLLQHLYAPEINAHGFICSYESNHGYIFNPSIVTNAKVHIKQKILLNVDLENFFPSISSERIYNVLSKDLRIKNNFADFITKICCTKNGLPQGAPTSPILSNIACRNLDKKLTRLCKHHNIKYSRYADDLSFSSKRCVFPFGFESELTNIILSEHFKINESKTRICIPQNRLEVTGITVNVKTNVQRKYIRRLRAIFSSIKKYGVNYAATKYYKFKVKENKKNLEARFSNSLRGRIEFIGHVRGKDDFIYKKYLEIFYEVFFGEKINISLNEELSHVKTEFLTPARVGTKKLELSEILNKYSISPPSDNFTVEVVRTDTSSTADRIIQEPPKMDGINITALIPRLEKYNQIIFELLETNSEAEKIKTRLKAKLTACIQILKQGEFNTNSEKLFLMIYSCINEFNHNHRKYINDKIKIMDKEIQVSNFYYDLFKPHPHYRALRFITAKKTSESLNHSDINKTSTQVGLFLIEFRREFYLKEFMWLNEIRNKLNLTHSSKKIIANENFEQRVSIIQCLWMYEFVYFLFSNRTDFDTNNYKKLAELTIHFEKYFPNELSVVGIINDRIEIIISNPKIDNPLRCIKDNFLNKNYAKNKEYKIRLAFRTHNEYFNQNPIIKDTIEILSNDVPPIEIQVSCYVKSKEQNARNIKFLIHFADIYGFTNSISCSLDKNYEGVKIVEKLFYNMKLKFIPIPGKTFLCYIYSAQQITVLDDMYLKGLDHFDL